MFGWKASGFRRWLYPALVLLVCGLMLASFALPWWTASLSVVTNPDAIQIYGWGLRHHLDQLRQFVIADETPSYQTTLAWSYLGISLGAVLLGLRLRGKMGAGLMALAGLGYLAYALAAVFTVTRSRLHELGYSLQGHYEWMPTGAEKNIGLITFSCGLQAGFYLALAAGVLCVALALFRGKITGVERQDHHQA